MKTKEQFNYEQGKNCLFIPVIQNRLMQKNRLACSGMFIFKETVGHCI